MINLDEVRQILFNTQNLDGVISDVAGTVSKTDRYGRTYLHLAAEYDHPEMVHLLMQIGFNPNCVEKIGLTPLGVAVVKGNSEMVSLLLQFQADCKFSLPNAYHLATVLGKNDIVFLFDQHLDEEHINHSTLLDVSDVSPLVHSEPEGKSDKDFAFIYDRRKVKTPTFGDNGVEKLI